MNKQYFKAKEKDMNKFENFLNISYMDNINIKYNTNVKNIINT